MRVHSRLDRVCVTSLCAPCFCVCHIQVISIFGIGWGKNVLACTIEESSALSRLDRACVKYLCVPCFCVCQIQVISIFWGYKWKYGFLWSKWGKWAIFFPFLVGSQKVMPENCFGSFAHIFLGEGGQRFREITRLVKQGCLEGQH